VVISNLIIEKQDGFCVNQLLSIKNLTRKLIRNIKQKTQYVNYNLLLIKSIIQ